MKPGPESNEGTRAGRAIPALVLRGTPRQRGLQYGERAAARIGRCYEIYSPLWAHQGTDWPKRRGNDYLELVAAHVPDAATELAAIAEGAGLPAWQVACINARTELFLEAAEETPVECTSAFFPRKAILGQNWDWLRQSEDLVFVLDVTRPDGHRLVTMTEPGMLAKAGMNCRGLGVALNILSGRPTGLGLPVHVMLRRLLELDDVDAGLRFLESVPRHTFSNILLAERSGTYAMVELQDDRIEYVRDQDECPAHTNHFLAGPDVPSADSVRFENSIARYERARAVIASFESCDTSDMRTLLADSAGEHAICRSYSPSAVLSENDGTQMDVGTVSSVVMDLAAGTFHATLGSPRGNPYTRFDLCREPAQELASITP